VVPSSKVTAAFLVASKPLNVPVGAAVASGSVGDDVAGGSVGDDVAGNSVGGEDGG
jgi:hypothetical protein